MSIILGLETAAEQSSVALLEEDRLAFEFSFQHGRDLSRVLMPALERCFELLGRRLNDVEAIAVSVGPGSFTGLRIGVTAAKTLAFALSVPVLPVSTLHALALCAPTGACQSIVPLIDARRGEYFGAMFAEEDGILRRVLDDTIATKATIEKWGDEAPEESSEAPEDATRSRPCCFVVAGQGAAHLPEVLKTIPGAVIVAAFPQARHVAALGQEMLARGETVRPMDLMPVYLRRSYAEEKSGE